MFGLGKSLINMNSDDQKTLLAKATPGQRRSAHELGFGFNSQSRQK